MPQFFVEIAQIPCLQFLKGSWIDASRCQLLVEPLILFFVLQKAMPLCFICYHRCLRWRSRQLPGNLCLNELRCAGARIHCLTQINRPARIYEEQGR